MTLILDAGVLWTFTLLWLAVVPTPGANSLMVTHVAMTRTPGHVAAAIAGNMVGVGTLAGGALLGLAAVLAAFPWARFAIQVLGAAYLVYFGIRLIRRGRGPKAAPPAAAGSGDARESNSGYDRTFAVGFLTAVSNAQAIAFVTGIYAVTGILGANLATGLASIGIMICCNSLYLGTLGWLFQRPAVRTFYGRFRYGLETTIGALFIILGGRLLWRELVV
jgi:threonine efflux protein